MTPMSIAEALSFLLTLYPSAGEKWPVPIREAFAENLRPLDITIEQFRAVAKDVRVNGKNTWCPPEGELLKRLRGIGTARPATSESQLTREHEEFRQYLDQNRDELAAHVAAWKETDARFAHWCDSWLLDLKYPMHRVWALKFIPWAMARATRRAA